MGEKKGQCETIDNQLKKKNVCTEITIEIMSVVKIKKKSEAKENDTKKKGRSAYQDSKRKQQTPDCANQQKRKLEQRPFSNF